jgi:hypothetical protein
MGPILIYWLVLHTSNHCKADTILRFNKKFFHNLAYWFYFIL